jgi:SNF2 family DNA or RNA helicase
VELTYRLASYRASLANVIMELRKCCNHPYLFDGAEPEFDGQFIMGTFRTRSCVALCRVPTDLR